MVDLTDQYKYQVWRRRTGYRRHHPFGYTTKREQLVIPLMDYVSKFGDRDKV